MDQKKENFLNNKQIVQGFKMRLIDLCSSRMKVFY